MIEVANYLKEHYYPHYGGGTLAPKLVPTNEMLLYALERHSDKVLTVTRNGQLDGVAIFLTLDDDTYKHLFDFDLSRVDVLARLLEQEGDNYHFILLTAKGPNVIRAGLQMAKRMNPKTISWFNQDMTRLHSRTLRGV